MPWKRNKITESFRQIFEYDNNDQELESISQEMPNTILWESESPIRIVLSGLFT